MARTVLHLSPHPDDEVAGMPATLMALRDAGWRVVNVACGLGRPGAAPAAARRGGGGLPARRLRAAALRSAAAALGRRRSRRRRGDARRAARAAAPELAPALVCAPSPHDGHHAHELVGRAARRALEAHPGTAPPLWLWGVWADLPFPTLIAPFDRARLAEIQHALAAHASELARLPLDRLLEARAVLNAGVARSACTARASRATRAVELAELLCEVVLDAGRLAARDRRGASTPRRRSPRPRRGRSAGG